MTQILSPRTGTRVLKKGFDIMTDGRNHYFIVEGKSFNTIGYISKAYVPEEVYKSYEVNLSGFGPVFELLETNYPYMELGKVLN